MDPAPPCGCLVVPARQPHTIFVSLICMCTGGVHRQRKLIRFVARKEISKVLNIANKTYVYRITPRGSFGLRREAREKMKVDKGGNLSVCEESAESHTPDTSFISRFGDKRWAALDDSAKLSVESLDNKQVDGAVNKGQEDAPQVTPAKEFSPKVVAEEGIDIVVEAGMPSDSAGKSPDHDKPEDVAGAVDGDHDDIKVTKAEDSSIKVTAEDEIDVMVQGQMPSGYAATGESEDDEMSAELAESILHFKTSTLTVSSGKRSKDGITDVEFD
jgi:hypothetical protein